MFDITTIGTASIDTFLELEDIVPYTDAKTRILRYSFPLGEKVAIKTLEEHFGGNAVNAAIGLQRLKVKTAIITALGTCSRCNSVKMHLVKEKVETRYIKTSDKSAINKSFILDWRKDKSDRVILSYHQQKNFSNLRFPKTRLFYLTSLGEHFQTVCAQIPKNTRLIINPGGFELAHSDELILPLLEKTEVLILNKTEAAHLIMVDPSSTSPEFMLSHILALGCSVVVITCGKDGVYAREKNDAHAIFAKSIPVAKIKEVTGAGDAFASGFLAGYLNKEPLEKALRFGILNSSSCIQKIGAQNGLLTFSALKKRYREEYGEK